MLVSVLVIAAVAALLWSPRLARGQRIPTETPAATATPVTQLNKPAPLNVSGTDVAWGDQSIGEDGYRVTATIGTTTRTFTLPPDSSRLDFPADFRAGCNSPLGGVVHVSVVAFKGAKTSEPATGMGGASICAPASPTPGSLVSLPPTGSPRGQAALPRGGLMGLTVALALMGSLAVRLGRRRA